MQNNKETISVLGAGSWGTSLALLLADKGFSVLLWDRNEERAKKMQLERVNNKYLSKSIQFPQTLTVTSNLIECVTNVVLVVIATPTHTIRSIVEQIKPHFHSNMIICNVSKGIENGTLMTMSQVIKDVIPQIEDRQIAALYGPSHAEEVGNLLPTTVVSASKDIETARKVRNIFLTPMFRVYSNTDLLGVEVGGSVKNIMAIAAGIADGIGFGDNAKAALITRGINEITKLGLVMGANKETFAGLTGIGDLIVTCMSKHSRNRALGEKIGKGMTLSQALATMTMVAEGVKTTQSTYDLAKKLNIEMPITDAVYQILFKDANPLETVKLLMTRSAKEEDWGN